MQSVENSNLLYASNYNSTENKPVKSYHHYIFDAVTYIPSKAYEKLKNTFSAFDGTIEAKMDEIRQASFENQKTLFIDALTSSQFHILRGELAKFFQALQPNSQDEYLKTCALKVIHGGHDELVSRCIHLLTYDQMKDLIGGIADKKGFDLSQLIENYKELFAINDEYQPYDVTMAFVKSEFKMLAPQFFNLIVTYFELLIESTQIFEVGQPPKSAWDAAYQLEVYYRIITIPTTIFWTINAYFPNPITAGAAFTLTCLCLLGFTYSYVRWLKSTPKKLPTCDNLTESARKNELIPIFAREHDVTKIAIQLIQNLNAKERVHPFMIGKAGVGKTSIIEELARLIQKGDFPELKGVEVHYTTGARIKSDFNGKSDLENIRKTIGSFEKKVLLVIDEIHILMKNDEFRTELLSLTDSCSRSLPLVIGLTSTDEYEKNKEYFDKPAVQRRLTDPLIIEETTEAETAYIIQSELNRCFPEIEDISIDLCKKLYALSKDRKDALEPMKSGGHLSAIAGKIRARLQGNHLNDELGILKGRLAEARFEKKGPINSDKLFEPLNKIKDLKVKIKQKKEEIGVYKKVVNEYLALKKLRRDKEVSLADLSSKISQQNLNPELKTVFSNQFLFEQFFIIPAMDEKLKQHIKQSKLQVAITEEMIEERLKNLAF